MNILKSTHKNFFIIITLLFVLVVFSLISWSSNERYDIYGSPDYLLNVFSSERLAYEHTLSYGKSLNDQYDEKIFAPIGTIVTETGDVLPATFPGIFILNAIALNFSENAIPFVVPLMAVLLLFFFFKLCNLFYSPKTSLFCSFLFVFSAPFIITAVSLLSNIPCLAFYFASLYYLFAGFKKDKFIYFVLSGIFASFAFWIRYDIIIAFLPLVIFLFYKDYRLHLRKISIAIIPFIISLAFLFLFVSIVYGGPLNNIGSFNEEQLIKNPTDRYQEANTISWLIPFSSLEGFLKNSIKYTLLINPLLFIAFIFGIFFYKKKYKKENVKENNAFFVFFLTLFSLMILYYVGGIFSGYETLAIGGTYPRYLLPAYAVMSIFAGYLLNNSNGTKKIIIWLIVITIYIPLNFYGVYFGNLGIKSAMASQKETIELIDNLHNKQLVHKNSVVFYRYNDFYFFPYYHVANYEALLLKGREEKLLWLVKDLLKKGYFVYFVQDDYYRSGLPEKYIKYFEIKGLSRSPISNYIWEIKNKHE